MTTALVLCAAIAAGGLGSVTRFLVDSAVSRRARSSFPLGTMVVNVSGAVVLGVLSGIALPSGVWLVAGAGAVGSYTTFSTWMFETQRAAEEHSRRIAAANVLVGMAAGLLAAALGRWLGLR